MRANDFIKEENELGDISVKKLPTIAAALRRSHYIQNIGRKSNGDIIVRRSFFYKSGKTADDLASHVQNILDQTGLAKKYQIVDKGEVWKPFKGGSKIANSSHWFVVIREAKDVINEDDELEQTQKEDNVMIPPLQQALEIEKAKLNPSRAKGSRPIRQLLRKEKSTQLPNQPD